jgi:lipoprotein-anchoring transpeptidase ErfK/SrfK
VAFGALLALSGCGSGKPAWHGGGESGKGAGKEIAITAPTDGATDVPTSTEIAFTANRAKETKVELAQIDGGAVDGEFRPDGATWVPATQLKYATKYTAKVTATVKGKTVTKTASFTTMGKPANLVRISTMIGDDQVVGVGMPIIVMFGVDVPKEQRAAVQKRFFVASDPPQEGAWNWFNPHEVHFRPKEYWRAGTKLSYRIATGGLPWGGKWFGGNDLMVKATVGPKIMMSVDNATKSMTVTKDDQVLRTLPVSLGKPTSPSSSGNMIVMVKNEWEWFDSSTFGIPSNSSDGYRTKVLWPLRLTWGGQYIHAAPWSVADQGRRNVSHGCTNISMENADWLWHLVQLGDPVVVKGTERGLDWGDGWTDWNVPFEQYVQGSAIPYTPSNATGPSPQPSRS